MENQISVNRIEMELAQWHSREEKFNKIFSFGLSSNRSLLQEKLRHYERIVIRYNGTQDLDERLALRIIKQERVLMERQLYPNILIRLLRKLFVALVKEPVLVRQETKEAVLNSQALQDQLRRTGFNISSSILEEMAIRGAQQFSVPISHYINEKEELSHTVLFTKDQSGQYRFEGFTTVLRTESQPEEDRKQHFTVTAGHIPDTSEAYNLLSGRAIQKDGTWFQLNFNDRKPDGNYRIKEFQPGYGYGLKEILGELPLHNKAEIDKLHDDLKLGKRQPVSFIKDGYEIQYFIEANPQFRSVNIYDANKRKVTRATALGTNTKRIVKSAQTTGSSQTDNKSKSKNLRVS